MAHDQVQLPAEPAEPQTFAAADVGPPSPFEANNRFDACIRASDGVIRRKAAEAGIRAGELERQVRLHLPSVDPGLLKPNRYTSAVQLILQTALERAAAIDLHERATALDANMKLLNQAAYQGRRDLRLEAVDGPSLSLRFDQIKPSVGNEYQSSLHYLQSIRGDTQLHFGLFLPDAELPMAYIAVSPCDRPYMVDGLSGGYRIEDVVVLTRMYGLPGLPTNVMSMMIKQLVQSVRRATGARVMLTAYNPLLGFNGSVYRASGFRPFATAPVAYSYDHRGQYATRRLGRDARLSRLDTPPNVLMARGLDRAAQGSLNEPKSLVRISDDHYWRRTEVSVGDILSPVPLGLVSSLRGLEQMLETMWSPQTAQACAAVGCSPSMMCNGQCVSSSIWLVRELKRRFHANAAYCHGHVTCADRASSSPPGHSWVEVDGGEGGSLVIDMALRTRRGKYICEDHRSLARRGIWYEAIERLTIDQLPAQKVWRRFESLDDEFYSLRRVAESR